MLRAVWLTIAKEFLLIRRDRVGLFMLLVKADRFQQYFGMVQYVLADDLLDSRTRRFGQTVLTRSGQGGGKKQGQQELTYFMVH